MRTKKDMSLWQASEMMRRKEAAGHRVRCLLRKIGQESGSTTAESLSKVELEYLVELELVVRILFAKSPSKPHWKEMAEGWSKRFPITHRVLLNTCQNEHESLLESLRSAQQQLQAAPSSEELCWELRRHRDSFLVNLKLIGRLFVYRMLAAAVIGFVVHDLLGEEGSCPQEQMIEFCCELLCVAGPALDDSRAGQQLLSEFLKRLQDLQQRSGSEVNRLLYSREVQAQVEHLVELRQSGWQVEAYPESRSKDLRTAGTWQEVAAVPLKCKDTIEKYVRCFLKKICPDNVKAIADSLTRLDLERADELESVFRVVFARASVKPHCCEMYVEMLLAMRTSHPEFMRTLLNVCQQEFASLLTSLKEAGKAKNNAPEELHSEMKRQREMLGANLRIIGHLFLRKAMAMKVIAQVVLELLSIGDILRQEFAVESVCELLQLIGSHLDSTLPGRALLSEFSMRLKDLKRGGSVKKQQQQQQVLSKRIQLVIQDLLDLRHNAWQRKVFKGHPRTTEDITTLEAVVQQWKHTRPTPGQAKKGLEYLLEIGFNDVQSQARMADAITELVVRRQVMTWDVLGQALESQLRGLERHRTVVPYADQFFHCLLAQLLVTAGHEFDPVILSQLHVASTTQTYGEFTWSLLRGALRKVQTLGGGAEVTQRAACELGDLLRRSKRGEFVDYGSTCVPEDVSIF